MEERRVDFLSPRRQTEFRHLLEAEYQELPAYLTEGDLWSPYVHTPEEYDGLVDVQRALQAGCAALLDVLPEDTRLQDLLAPRFGEPERRQLEEMQDVPLGTQFIRPDYIYDLEGRPRVCEINARFIFNGNIASVHMAEYLAWQFAVDVGQYEKLDGFMRDTYDGAGSDTGPTVFVHDDEPHHDLLLQKQRSGAAQSVKPEMLKLLDARKIGRLVLELHQYELAPVFSDISRLMREGASVYNDPRVVSWLHDKRLLVALSDEDYMSPLVGADTARTLASGIVPSYHPSWEGREPEEIPSKTALAKGAISGKGDDKHLVRLATYKQALESPQAYVYQPRLLQPKLASPGDKALEIAGTLPMTLDGDVFGPGIVRIVPHYRMKGHEGFTIAVRGEE